MPLHRYYLNGRTVSLLSIVSKDVHVDLIFLLYTLVDAQADVKSSVAEQIAAHLDGANGGCNLWF